MHFFIVIILYAVFLYLLPDIYLNKISDKPNFVSQH